ncbi:nucleotidyltransferase family protein [Pseudanabaena yagii GIHE-NHR1]|uniref:Nucleotidyltransferase family protein n=1 Tax=Pseudanabaena yagii GIHE-NHR1 TaxID=2722753 RepID=A0ABX1LU57_9CYAN|nr:nucleotidyltransferase family protein [Pseudanabaena yagii GIHE-NHR1]
MSCEEAITLLQEHREMIAQFHVSALFLFGSVGRNEANVKSDVDLLVEFEKPVGLFTFARLQRYLEKVLGCAIDLGTPDSLQPYFRDIVLAESKRVF